MRHRRPSKEINSHLMLDYRYGFNLYSPSVCCNSPHSFVHSFPEYLLLPRVWTPRNTYGLGTQIFPFTCLLCEQLTKPQYFTMRTKGLGQLGIPSSWNYSPESHRCARWAIITQLFRPLVRSPKSSRCLLWITNMYDDDFTNIPFHINASCS